MKLKKEFQLIQNSGITKEFSEQFIKRVEVSPENTVTVTFYFDELLKEIGVNDIVLKTNFFFHKIEKVSLEKVFVP